MKFSPSIQTERRVSTKPSAIVLCLNSLLMFIGVTITFWTGDAFAELKIRYCYDGQENVTTNTVSAKQI